MGRLPSFHLGGSKEGPLVTLTCRRVGGLLGARSAVGLPLQHHRAAGARGAGQQRSGSSYAAVWIGCDSKQSDPNGLALRITACQAHIRVTACLTDQGAVTLRSVNCVNGMHVQPSPALQRPTHCLYHRDRMLLVPSRRGNMRLNIVNSLPNTL